MTNSQPTKQSSISQNLDPFTMKLNDISLIEASAGSGKTYNIVNLFLRLILNLGQNLDNANDLVSSPLSERIKAKEILVVTFTKDATKEMSTRISKKLIEILSKLKAIKEDLDLQAQSRGLSLINPSFSDLSLTNPLVNQQTDDYFTVFRNESVADFTDDIFTTKSLNPYFTHTPDVIKKCLKDVLGNIDEFEVKILNQIIAQGRVQQCIDILKTEIVNNEFSIKTIDSFCKETVDTYSLLTEQGLYQFANLLKELSTKALERVVTQNFPLGQSFITTSQIPLFNIGRFGTKVLANLEGFDQKIDIIFKKIYPEATSNFFSNNKEPAFIEFCQKIFQNFSLDTINQLAKNYLITPEQTVLSLLDDQTTSAINLLKKVSAHNPDQESSLQSYDDLDCSDLEQILVDISKFDERAAEVMFVNFYHQWLIFFLQRTYKQYLQLCEEENVIYFEGYQRTLRDLLFNNNLAQVNSNVSSESKSLNSNSNSNSNSNLNSQPATSELQTSAPTTNDKLNSEQTVSDVILSSIRNTYKFGIIDEFQDTSPIQFEIFSKIFIHDFEQSASARTNEIYDSVNSHNLDNNIDSQVNESPIPRGFIMIGDPKQSIYGFRGADIFSYFTARQQANYTYTIQNNYRSSPDFVHSCNLMFGAQYNGFHIPLINYPIAAPGKKNLTGITFLGKPVSPITFYNIFKINNNKNVHAIYKKTEHYIAQVIAKFIDLGKLGLLKLNGKNLEPKDICVLEQKNVQLKTIKAELQALGINTNLNSDIELKKDNKIFLALYDLLNAIINPLKTNLHKYVFSYLSGLNLEQGLSLINNNEESVKFLAKLSQYKQIWEEQGLLSMIQTVVLDNKILARAQSYQNPQLILELQDIFNLVNYIVRTVKNCNQATEVLYFLDNIEAKLIKLEEEQVNESKLEHKNSVNIATIHGSKGLEYGLVFSTYIGDEASKLTSSLLDHTPNLSNFLNPYSKIDQAFVSDCNLSEFQRLHYVLLTRPKFGFIGFIGKKPEFKNNPIVNQANLDDKFFNFLQVCAESIDHEKNIDHMVVQHHNSQFIDHTAKVVNYQDFYQQEFAQEYQNYLHTLNQSNRLINYQNYTNIDDQVTKDTELTDPFIAPNITFYQREGNTLSYFLPPHVYLATLQSYLASSKSKSAQSKTDSFFKTDTFAECFELQIKNYFRHINALGLINNFEEQQGLYVNNYLEMLGQSLQEYDINNPRSFIYSVNPVKSDIDLFAYVDLWIRSDEVWQKFVRLVQQGVDPQQILSNLSLNVDESLESLESLENQPDFLVGSQSKQTTKPSIAVDQKLATTLAKTTNKLENEHDQDLATNHAHSNLAKFILPYLINPKPSLNLSPTKAKKLFIHPQALKTSLNLSSNQHPSLNSLTNSSSHNQVINSLTTVNTLDLEPQVFDSYAQTKLNTEEINTNGEQTTENVGNNQFTVKTSYITSIHPNDEQEPYHKVMLSQVFSVKPTRNFTYLQSFTNLNRVTKNWFEDVVHKDPILNKLDQNNAFASIESQIIKLANNVNNVLANAEASANEPNADLEINSEKYATSQALYQQYSNLSYKLEQPASGTTSALSATGQDADIDEIDSTKQQEFAIVTNEFNPELDLMTDVKPELDMFDLYQQNLTDDLEVNQLVPNSELEGEEISNSERELAQAVNKVFDLSVDLDAKTALLFLPGGTSFGTKVHNFFEMYDPLKVEQTEFALKLLVTGLRKESEQAVRKMVRDSLQYPIMDLTALKTNKVLSTRQQLTLDLYQFLAKHPEVDHSLLPELEHLNLNDFSGLQQKVPLSSALVSQFVEEHNKIVSLNKNNKHKWLKLSSLDVERINEWNFVIRPPIDENQADYMIRFIDVLIKHKVLLADFKQHLETSDQLYHLLVNGKFEGAVDLMLFTNKEIFVIDYKTNNLGSSLEDYNQLSLFRYMNKSGYLLQIYVYLAATYAYLSQGIFANNYKLLENLQFIGMNLFTKAMLEVDNDFKNTGVYFELPSHQLLQELASIIQPYLSFSEN